MQEDEVGPLSVATLNDVGTVRTQTWTHQTCTFMYMLTYMYIHAHAYVYVHSTGCTRMICIRLQYIRHNIRHMIRIRLHVHTLYHAISDKVINPKRLDPFRQCIWRGTPITVWGVGCWGYGEGERVRGMDPAKK